MTPESLSTVESNIFATHLQNLEKELAAGSHDHSPLHFLASLEIEFEPYKGEVSQAMVDMLNDPWRVDDLKAANIMSGVDAFQAISLSERVSRVSDVRYDAWKTVSNLTPQNEQETERKKNWLQQIADFDMVDAINFRLYERFSTPTLTEDTAVPGDATYEAIEQYTHDQGWLEFRFGKGTLQSGYYDNEDVSEIRFTPCAPTELARRQAIVKDYIAKLAIGYGSFVAMGGSHLNISAFRHSAETGRRHAIIGTASGKEADTLHALAGLGEALEDGAWLTGNIAQNPRYFFDLPNPYLISSDRNAVRVKRDYLELRANDIMDSTEHDLLFMMAALATGLEQGWGKVAARAKTVPRMASKLRATATTGFDKQQQLQMLRGLQKSTQGSDGFLELASGHNLRCHAMMAKEFNLDPRNPATDPYYNSVLNFFAIGSVVVGAEGMPAVTPESVERAYKRLKLPQGTLEANRFEELLRGPGAEKVARRLGDLLKGIVYQSQTIFTAEVNHIGLSPAETKERLLTSQTFQRMYGQEAARYAALIEQQALPGYNETTFEAEGQKLLKSVLGFLD